MLVLQEITQFINLKISVCTWSKLFFDELEALKYHIWGRKGKETQYLLPPPRYYATKILNKI